MATDINRTTTITLPGEVSSEILQKTQESSAVMALARSIKLPGLGVTIPVITGDPSWSSVCRWHWPRSSTPRCLAASPCRAPTSTP